MVELIKLQHIPAVIRKVLQAACEENGGADWPSLIEAVEHNDKEWLDSFLVGLLHDMELPIDVLNSLDTQLVNKSVEFEHIAEHLATQSKSIIAALQLTSKRMTTEADEFTAFLRNFGSEHGSPAEFLAEHPDEVSDGIKVFFNDRYEETKYCEFCSEAFKTAYDTKKYCSTKCQRKAAHARVKSKEALANDPQVVKKLLVNDDE